MVWRPEWWAYGLITIALFFVCLLLNYIVKKINEARLEARLIRLEQKTPASQSTQVQGPLIEMETKLPDKSQNLCSSATQQIKEVNMITNEEINPENNTSKYSTKYNGEILGTSHNTQFELSEKESITLNIKNQHDENVTFSADSIKTNEVNVNIPCTRQNANESKSIKLSKHDQSESDYKGICQNGDNARISRILNERVNNNLNEVAESIALPVESTSLNSKKLNLPNENS